MSNDNIPKDSLPKVLSKRDITEISTWSAPRVGEINGGGSGPSGHNMKTDKQIERIQKQAYDDAYKQGYSKGIQDGDKHMLQKSQLLQTVINSLASPLKAIDEEIQSELVSLCIALMKQLIRRELKSDPGQIIAVVREALAELPMSARNIQIRLHPEDVKLVTSVMSLSSDDGHWKIMEDPIISRGGCKINTETSQMDVTVESRVNTLISKVFGGLRESD